MQSVQLGNAIKLCCSAADSVVTRHFDLAWLRADVGYGEQKNTASKLFRSCTLDIS